MVEEGRTHKSRTLRAREGSLLTQESPLPSQSYPENSQATTALILGVVGVVSGPAGFFLPFVGFLGLLSPFAWYVGRKEMKAIDAGLRDPAFRTNAKVGMILGIVGTVLLIFAILFLILIIILLSTSTF